MDTMGFVFGISGMTFGLLGFIYGTNAISAVKSVADRVDQLEQRFNGN